MVWQPKLARRDDLLQRLLFRHEQRISWQGTADRQTKDNSSHHIHRSMADNQCIVFANGGVYTDIVHCLLSWWCLALWSASPNQVIGSAGLLSPILVLALLTSSSLSWGAISLGRWCWVFPALAFSFQHARHRIRAAEIKPPPSDTTETPPTPC